MEQYFKILVDGQSCQGGEFTWSLPQKQGDEYIPGDWHLYEGEISICESGFHLTNNPYKWRIQDETVYECEIHKDSKRATIYENDKIAVSHCRLLKPLNGELTINKRQAWYKEGKLHRDGDLPAAIYAYGDQEWWKDVKQHRDGDLPAEIYPYGTQEWWKEGKLHRDGDFPAVIYINGDQVWYKEGKLHRDGNAPAVMYANGNQYWCKEGNVHRDGDLPAIIYAYGGQSWYKEGKPHRDGNAPAVIWADGDQEWWKEGKRHRDGGLLNRILSIFRLW